ncbi:rhodanese-like domain-containing protein, partial [Staphylococcus haemolyticus]|uniref:rhodanese-like domain-containing protein n=1 Tax=Staphylococcus haemolyticus TaxID=1283 RepID=UPI00214D4DF2
MSLRPMTAERIAKMVVEDESLFILDVRSEEAYEDWNIEGLRTDSRNVPYATFQEAIDETIDQLPKDRPILVVCAKEKTSILVGEELAARSIDVYYLE